MASIRVREETKTLYIDFRYRGVRCRELTKLKDNARNRQRLQRLLKKIEKDIKEGSFSYRMYFPTSKRAELFEPAVNQPINYPDKTQNTVLSPQSDHCSVNMPLFSQFSDQWYKEKEITWKRSQQIKVCEILAKHIHPRFRGRRVNEITKQEILEFRVTLAKEGNKGKGLSPARINQIINILRQIIVEAAERLDFRHPFHGLTSLKVPKSSVEPFSLEEVQLFLKHVPEKYRNYYIVAFFTGMRTSEQIGLKKQYVDFHRNEILIREAFVVGRMEETKTQDSKRVIQMSSIVRQALEEQVTNDTSDSPFVFPAREGQPIRYRNLSFRVWYPTLEKAGLRRRKPYQTRHTAATLWLASGENPEWIARQMGHSTTKMLFTVYSRYVPNLTRQDGSAMETLLTQRFDTLD